MVVKRFHQFVNFGVIANKRVRARLVEALYDSLYKGNAGTTAGTINLGLSAGETDNFAGALERIIANPDLLGLCEGNKLMCEQTIQDCLNFIFNTVKLMERSESPYRAEEYFLQEFSGLGAKDFPAVWNETVLFIREAYPNAIAVDFFDGEFKKSLAKKKTKNKIIFESVRSLFSERWGGLLDKKIDSWKKAFIEEQCDEFCDAFYREVENLAQARDALDPSESEMGRLWSSERGRWEKTDFSILGSYMEYFNRDPSLRALVKSLGRSRETEFETDELALGGKAPEGVWVQNPQGRSELTGIHQSGDLSALLPGEIALLTGEKTELIFYRRYTENKLQTFEYQDRQLVFEDTNNLSNNPRRKKMARGPVILCVDTSGSMRGEPEKLAKTLCYALLKMALNDKRQCYLISFSTQIETLELSDLSSSLEKLAAFLSMNFNGGSNAEPALQEALLMLETEDYKNADVLMVSDFILPAFNERTVTRIRAAKENKTRFHSVLIGDISDKIVNQSALGHFDTNLVYDAFQL
jgi:uncharacterized protein with von Willebrand factor type A (vWA) domain